MPEKRWADIAMDFVTGLLLYQGMNAILSITDRLTKERHYIPYHSGDNGTTAKEIANLFVREIWKLYSLPQSIVSDRGSQFTVDIWKE